MNNEERQAETAADGSTKAQVTTSTLTCSNTLVSGSTGKNESDFAIRLHEWVLLVDIDFFGRMIYAGTIFRQVNADYYHPIINGARCPSYQIDFMIVKNNPKAFLRLLK